LSAGAARVAMCICTGSHPTWCAEEDVAMGTCIKLREITVPQLPEQETWAAKMRAAMRAAITEEDVAAVASKIVEDAKAGNRQAQAQLLGLLNSGPKTITVNQYRVVRRRKRRGSKDRVVEPRREPTLEEVRDRAAELRRRAGKPVHVAPVA